MFVPKNWLENSNLKFVSVFGSTKKKPVKDLWNIRSQTFVHVVFRAFRAFQEEVF